MLKHGRVYMNITINSGQAASVIYPNKYHPIDMVIREVVRSYFNASNEFEGNIASNYSKANFNAACFDFELETGIDIKDCENTTLGNINCTPHGKIDENSIIMIRIPYSAKDSGEFSRIQSQSHYYAKAQVQMHVSNTASCYFYQWSPIATSSEVIEIDKDFITELSEDLDYFFGLITENINNPGKHLVDIDNSSEAKKLSKGRIDALAKIKAIECAIAGIEDKILLLSGGVDKNIGGAFVKDGKIT